MCEQDECSFITINVDALRMHAKKHHNIAWMGGTTTLASGRDVQRGRRGRGGHSPAIVRNVPEDFGEASGCSPSQRPRGKEPGGYMDRIKLRLYCVKLRTD
jgi:hypothetical protein